MARPLDHRTNPRAPNRSVRDLNRPPIFESGNRSPLHSGRHWGVPRRDALVGTHTPPSYWLPNGRVHDLVRSEPPSTPPLSTLISLLVVPSILSFPPASHAMHSWEHTPLSPIGPQMAEFTISNDLNLPRTSSQHSPSPSWFSVPPWLPSPLLRRVRRTRGNTLPSLPLACKQPSSRSRAI